MSVAAPPGGRFGTFGGTYVPESLVPACGEVAEAFAEAWRDPGFRTRYADLLGTYAGRPTPLTDCGRLSEHLGVRVLLKREDLAHTGSHKINNVIGQALLAQRMGKRRLIAETGAGQHGVATATAAAMLGLGCTVYMGEVDVARQELNVFRMRLLGAEVVPVTTGSRTLKDAVSEAMRAWVSEVETTHYCLGSVLGPHPYPWMVRELQRVLGDEARAQCAALLAESHPHTAVACVGGGSNAAGTFAGFERSPTRLVGVEAAGGAALAGGSPGYLHGSYSWFLQDGEGQIREATSISAGLDYPGIGPEHAWWAATGRVRYVTATDEEALAAVALLARTEGILAALESAHAVAWVARTARGEDLPEGSAVLVTLSGRGDKGRPTTYGAPAVTGLETHLRQRRDLGRPLLVPYVMAGITGDWTRLVCAMAGAGADAVEVGLPFSDPMVDGPTLQQASARALTDGARPSRLVEALEDVDATVPVVLMAYANTVHARGVGSFIDRAAGAGIAGVIVPDLPLEESQEYENVTAAAGIASVLLAAPSCSEDRIGAICARSRGFVYAVSAMRTTGERDSLADSALPTARRVKSCTDRPVLAGFGISSPSQAAAVAAVADGVVVASSLMRLLLDGASQAAVLESVAELRRAIDGVA